MVQPSKPPANGLVALVRKMYNPLGFAKGYNFVLFFITAGALMGFTLARLQYLSYYGIFCKPGIGESGAAPGECVYWLKNPYKIGMMLHLFTILPAAFLVCFQFVPAIRHKFIILHRINGYTVVLLALIANAGVIIVLPHAFGGDLATRTWGGAIVISTTISLALGVYNIKRLQIEQHRAWMMRAWVYFASSITIRVIQEAAVVILTSIGHFYINRPCSQIDGVYGDSGPVLGLYPGCESYYSGENLAQHVVVAVNVNSRTDAMEATAAYGIVFGSAGWLAWWIHAVLVELYLNFTPAETERLREVSYQRQRERGMKHPGSAGLVPQSSGFFGDANPYVPISQRRDPGSLEEMDLLKAAKRGSGGSGAI